MNFFQRRGPVLMFVFVLAVSLAFLSAHYSGPKVREDIRAVNADRDVVEQALKTGNVAGDYIYSAERAAEITSSEQLKHHAERARRTIEHSVGTFVAYPQPMRPNVEEPATEPVVKPRYAVLGTLSDLKATPLNGRIYVSCDLPKADELLMMEPVRIEIFRGRSGVSIDTSKPYGVIELAPEEPSADKKIIDAKSSEPGTTRHRGEKMVAAPFKLPERQRVFRDTQVDQQKEYSYMARLVARFKSSDGKQETVTDTDGKKIIYAHHAPQNATPVVPANLASQSKLYVTPLTAVVRATTPSNFELRLAGINGTIPNDLRNPNKPFRTGYSARLEVSIWITEIQAWKSVQLGEVEEGQTLSGKVMFRARGAGESTVYDFTRDLGYRLLELNNEEIAGKGPLPVATIENQKMKVIEKLPLAPAVKRSEQSTVFDKIIEAQAREFEAKK